MTSSPTTTTETTATTNNNTAATATTTTTTTTPAIPQKLRKRSLWEKFGGKKNDNNTGGGNNNNSNNNSETQQPPKTQGLMKRLSIGLGLAKNANPDMSPGGKGDALLNACKQNNNAVALRLIKAGAKVDGADRFGKTPLHHACHFGNVTLVEAILEKGPSVDVQCDENDYAFPGWTPLHFAVAGPHKNIEVVRLLLSEAPDLSITDKKGKRAIDSCTDAAMLQLLRDAEAKMS
jgi:ankyrin repeat protein